MRIAVMADIHSNSIAFRACLQEAERRGCTEYLFLGDYLGDLAKPQITMRMLEEIRNRYPCTFIRGNKEDYWIRHRMHPEEIWESGHTATGMLRYVMDSLTDTEIDWFEGMPISQVIRKDGYPPFVICHGSPFHTRESLRPDYDTDELMTKMPTDLVICGHFHIQVRYEKKGVCVINPGSVGVPLRSGGLAQFMTLEAKNGAWDVQFVSVPYDMEAAIGSMDQEKLYEKAPGWYRMTKLVLTTGLVSHADVVRRAAKAAQEQGISTELARIPEEIWQKTIDDLEEERHLPHQPAGPQNKDSWSAGVCAGDSVKRV